MALAGPRDRPARHRRHPPVEDRRAGRDRRRSPPSTSIRERIPEGLAAIARPRGHRPQARRRALARPRGAATSTSSAAAVADGRLDGVAGFGPATRARVAEQLAQRAARGGDATPSASRSGSALPAGRGDGRRPARRRARVRASRWPAACGAAASRSTTSTWSAAADGPAALQDALVGAPRGASGRWRAATRAHRGRHPRRGARSSWPVGPPGVVRQPPAARDRLGGPQRPPARAGRAPRPVGVRSTASPGPTGTVTRGRRGRGLRGPRARARSRPELREDAGEIEAALAGPLPRAGRARRHPRRAALAHHLERRHRSSVAAMVEAARARGYALPGDQRPLAQPGDGRRPRPPSGCAASGRRSPRRTRATTTSRCCRATEVDILADGRIDFDDELLAGFDWVTASMHSGPDPGRRAHHRAGCWRPSRAPSWTPSGTPPGGCWAAATPRRSTSTAWPRPPPRDRAPSSRSTASRAASTSTRPWRGAPWRRARA